MTTLISITLIVILVIGLALAIPWIRRQNRESNVARAEQLRSQAASSAQTVIPPAVARAEEAEATAEEARAAAEQAEAEALQARVAASQAEAAHEDRIRAADRLDPRVDHKADDYAPQVGGTEALQPTSPPAAATDADAKVAPEPAPAADAAPEPATEPAAEPAAEQPGAEQPAAEEPAAEQAASEPAAEPAPTSSTPLLPRRTPGANEMPGKPMESEGGGGWFTRKDSSDS